MKKAKSEVFAGVLEYHVDTKELQHFNDYFISDKEIEQAKKEIAEKYNVRIDEIKFVEF